MSTSGPMSSGGHPTPRSRRVLITGLSSQWGGRVAQLLEQDEAIDVLVGVDTADPRHELERTEFVRVGSDDSLLRRIIRAAAIDTILDTRLLPDGFADANVGKELAGVDATRSLLAACGGEDSPVRKFVFKSSADYYGAGKDDPSFFSEEMMRTRMPRTALEWDVALGEAAVNEFAADNPGLTVTTLRCTTAVGSDLRSPHLALLALPMVPSILGFDPRWQFVHEDDVLGAMAYAVQHTLPGAYNVAGDGVLALSEIVSLLGKAPLPVLPPWGSVFASRQLRRFGLPMPVELVRDLRHGRGLDNRRLKSAGYRFRYTSREAVLRLRAHHRLQPLLGSGDDSYRYEREVEEFLRWSPSVRPALEPGAEAPSGEGRKTAAPISAYDELTVAELLAVIGSLEATQMRELRAHEAAGPRRKAVLEALDQQLMRRGG
jgi:UDP-glucose 4-epimerase